MIYDNIKNASRYAEMPRIVAALAAVERFSDPTLDLGSYPLCDGVRAVVNDYETKPYDARPVFESHRVYADLQVIVSGTERILAAPDGGIVARPYDEESDYELLDCDERVEFTMRPGDFLYLAPGEPHCPGMAVALSERVRKIVFKIEV